MTRPARCQRPLALVMLICFLSGCYKWSVQPAPESTPERARITLSDGRVVELRSLEIRGDSVVGFAKTESRERTGQPVWGDTLQTYPLADVTEFEVRKTDRRKTIALVGGLAGIAFLAAMTIWIAVSFSE